MIDIIVEDWGVIDYKQGYDRQIAYISSASEDEVFLIFCEHYPVITIGRSPSGILFKKRELINKSGIAVIETDRGGSVSAHFPGQLMVYVLFCIKHLGLGLRQWMNELENLVHLAILDCGVELERREHGLWFGDGKVVSFGLSARKYWVYHGGGITYKHWEQVNQIIFPCGLKDKYFLGLDRVVDQMEDKTKKEISREQILYSVTTKLTGLIYDCIDNKMD